VIPADHLKSWTAELFPIMTRISGPVGHGVNTVMLFLFRFGNYSMMMANAIDILKCLTVVLSFSYFGCIT
jgi:hypothetical protein